MAKKQKKQIEAPEAIKNLIQAANDLGWTLAIPNMESEDHDIPGLIVGDEIYVNKVLSYIPEGVTFSLPGETNKK